MSYITKLILRMGMNRVRDRTLQEIAPEQYDFLPDKGARNAIFVLRSLKERLRSKRHKKYYMHVSLTTAKHFIH